MKATITGRATTTETAIRSFHLVPTTLAIPARTTVIGWYFSSLASASPNTNSPHAARKPTTATVMTPGVLSGTTTRQNAVSSLQPSTFAASTMSVGTLRKYGRRIVTASGIASEQ